MKKTLKLLTSFWGMIFTIIIGIIITISVFFYIQNKESEKTFVTFLDQSQKQTSAITRKLDNLSIYTRTLSKFHENSDTVTLSEFESFAAHLLDYSSSIQALEWVPAIQKNNLQKYKNQIRIHYPNFNFREFVEKDSLKLIEERDYYYPIYYILPYKGNENAHGFDFNSQSDRRAALERAIETKKTSISSAIRLILDNEVKNGFIMFEPIYKDVEKSNLEDFSVCVFRIDDVIKEALEFMQNLEINIYIFDNSSNYENNHIYGPKSNKTTTNRTSLLKKSKFNHTTSFNMCGRNWEIICIPQKTFFNVHKTHDSILALIIGFLFTSIIGVILFRLNLSKSKLENLVQRRTHIIHEQNLKLQINEESLKKNNELLHTKNDEYETLNEELKEKNEEYEALNEELTEKNTEYEVINTELKEANSKILSINKDLHFAKEKALESDKLKSAFLANMSHEIRTPMNGIIGFTKILKNPQLTTENRNRYTGIVENSGKQLLNIVNDIIDISKIEAGQINLREERFSLSKLIDDLALIYKPLASAKNIDFLVSKDLGINEVLIISDKVKIRQIIENLISNALKFTKSGYIKLSCKLVNENIEFCIEDTGIGINNDLQNVIFDRFRQAETELSSEYGGTGLGLSISKGYIEKLGGKIWIDSEIDKGSVFFFQIPFKS